jgi:Tol biopolymer transport system component/serine/threonine protein kinase
MAETPGSGVSGRIPETIGRYRLLSRLGGGGMGEVYLARDSLLERNVALKILAPDTAADPERMRRFEQEARAAAALNHPNIAHIYEAGEVSGLRYLAMEYVEGRTIAERIRDGPLELTAVVDLAVQAADAVAEAHRNGITHRDLKPSNLMVTPRGQLKVLDFGLAKIAGPLREKAAAAGPNAPTRTVTMPITESGTVVGTVQYMSPEQALGREVDHRSDIFSLGAVLYEMATGRAAFPGNTAAAVFDGILNHTPAPMRDTNPEVPPELEQIVFKALEKDPELRYQTAADLRADLRRLQRDSGSVAVASRRPRRFRPWLWAAVAVALVIAAVMVARRRAPTPRAALVAVPLTSYPGNESQASFSPDGNQVAFAWNGETETDWDIYVKVVGAGTPLRLTRNPATDYSPVWSPDGKHIAFLRESEKGSAFWIIPALGGLEQKVADAFGDRIGLNTPYADWMPDGAGLVLVNKEPAGGPMRLYQVSLADGRNQLLTDPPADWLGDSSPVVSPDGSRLAFVRTASLSVQDIYVMEFADRRPRRLTFDGRRIFGLAWSPLSGKLIFSSARGGTSSRLWQVPPSGGEPEPLAGGVGENATFIAVSRQGTRLAYTRSVIDTNIWRYPIPGKAPAGAQPARLLSSTRHEQGPKYSPDGQRIAFSSNRSGAQEIWVSDRDGVNANRLTSFEGPATGSPAWSPDGRNLAFDSRPEGNPDIYVVSAEGGLPRRLTTEPAQDVLPRWSRDGAFVYFASNRTGRFEVWKVPTAGGAAVQVTHHGGFHAVESEDGKYVYYAKSPTEDGLWRVEAKGGREEPVLASFRRGFWGYWALAGGGIYFLQREEIEGQGVRYFLRFLDLTTRRERLVMPLPRRPFNAGLDIAPDGTHFLYTQVDQSDSDIMLVENFR